MPANYYQGAVHPSGNYRMTEAMATSLLPLLASQRLEVGLWDGERLDVDLDLMRQIGFPYSSGHIARWYAYAFHCHFDVAQPWLSLQPATGWEDKVVVGRTSRYHNDNISYSFMGQAFFGMEAEAEWKDREEHWRHLEQPVFLGLEEEYVEFVKWCPRAVWHPTNNFLEAAQIVRGCKVFCGNQSALFAVAEGLKSPRVLEVCLWAPNVVVTGKNGRDAINQGGFEANIKDFLR